MSEREEHNELIHRLAERLRDHTVPYKEGAWERFVAVHGKRRRKLWPYWSAAAMLLAAFGLYWSTRYTTEMPITPQLVQQGETTGRVGPTEQERDMPDRTDTEVTSDQPVLPVDHSGKGRERHTASEEQFLVGTSAEVRDETAPAAAAVDTSAVPSSEPHRLAVAIEPERMEQPVEDARSGIVFNGRAADFNGRDADADNHAGTFPKPDSDMGKWDLGLVVSPSLTSETVNIGGGVAVAYRISDKFSIGSGIAVAQLGLGENPNYQPRYDTAPNSWSPTVGDYFNGKSEQAVDYKREVSLTSSVVMLDIPLDLRYDVAKNFYTSVGISYVAVLNEQRTGHYVDKINVNTFGNGNSSTAERLATTEFVYSSEKIPAKPLRGNGYAGFMNFSIGKKLPISSKLFLSVEPYFKLPIGRLSKEEMNFTNGGIRIVTGF